MSAAPGSNLSAPVLARLLLMQSLLESLPDERAIGEFVCRGLSELPGVREARWSADSVPVEDEPFLRFPLMVGTAPRGELALRLSDPALFQPYEPYIKNFCFMLAVVLEARLQRRSLEEQHVELERRVEERTRVLATQMAERSRMLEEAERVRRALLDTVEDQVQAKAALRATEARYRALFENATIGIYRTTPDGRVQDANAMLLRMLGYDSLTELQQRSLGKGGFAGPQSRADFRERIERDGALWGWEATWVRKDGTTVFVNESARVVRDSAGKVVCYEGFVEDITKHRHLEEQLRQSQKLEAVGVLAGGVAHDFRNLLQIIQSHVELLMAGRDLGSGSQGLREVARATERAAEIVDQLLAFSRTGEARARPVDLNEVARDVGRLMDHTLPKRIRLELDLADSLPPVHGDPGQLEQVLLNLALNARDAITNVGTLRIATEMTSAEAENPSARTGLASGDYAALHVSDTGHGMDAQTMQKVFDPFFTTKPVGQGTGLGLAVAYGIVKACGGQISCSSSPGRGSTFKVLLPVSTDTPRPAREPDQATVDAARGSATVLLVDDEQPILAAMEEVLTGRGYRTLSATSGEAALEIYRREGPRIGVVVLDLGMPGMGGEACLRQLLELNPRAKVIVSSGYAPAGGAEAGAAAFLGKPYRLPALLATLRQVLAAPLAETPDGSRG